jgi:hypothetical protein
MNDPARPNRRILYVLIVVFFGPLAASFALYYGSSWRPVSQTNHGELYVPARALPTSADALLREEWTLVYVGDGTCAADACRNALVFGRQVRLALGKEMARVRRVLLATSNCCGSDYLAHEHEGVHVIDATAPGAAALVDVFPAQDRDVSLYVVDPLGNLVMRYDSRQEPKGFLTDLKKLLKLSHIG